MNLQERLAQCQIDRRTIQKKEQELLDAIKEEELQKISFARFIPDIVWDHSHNNNRLILHLTPEFVRLVNIHKGDVVSLYKSDSGVISIGCYDHKPTKNGLISQYHKTAQLLID